MPSRSFVMLAALVMSSTRVIAGCSGGDDGTYQTDPARNGYSETAALHVTQGTGKVDVGEVETALSPSSLFVFLHADALAESPTVVMELPVAAGDHRLSELHATLLVPGKAEPVAIDGVLHVRDVAPPCGTGACGRLDAVLELDAATAASRAWLSGEATLSYSEEIVTVPSSGGGGGGGGCGQENNPWAMGSYGGSR